MPAIGFRDQHSVADNVDGIPLDALDGARGEYPITFSKHTRLDAQRVNAVNFQFVVKIFNRAGASPLRWNDHRQTAQLRPFSYSHTSTPVNEIIEKIQAHAPIYHSVGHEPVVMQPRLATGTKQLMEQAEQEEGGRPLADKNAPIPFAYQEQRC